MGLPHCSENSSKAGILSYSSGFLTTSKLLDTKVFIHSYGRQEERMGENKEKRKEGESER